MHESSGHECLKTIPARRQNRGWSGPIKSAQNDVPPTLRVRPIRIISRHGGAAGSCLVVCGGGQRCSPMAAGSSQPAWPGGCAASCVLSSVSGRCAAPPLSTRAHVCRLCMVHVPASLPIMFALPSPISSWRTSLHPIAVVAEMVDIQKVTRCAVF